MQTMPAIVFKRIAPFIASLAIHLGLLFFLYVPTTSRNTAIKIEVLLQKRSGEPSSPVTKGQRKISAKKSEAMPPQSVSAVSQENQNLSDDITSNGDEGSDESTVLGSSIGIHAHYPRLSRLMGESGAVVISVESRNANVSKTSGFARLDESALEATQLAIQGGLLSEVLSTKARMQIRFIFRLIDSQYPDTP